MKSKVPDIVRKLLVKIQKQGTFSLADLDRDELSILEKFATEKPKEHPLLKKLEAATLVQQNIRILTTNEQSVIPWKIIHLEGVLSLIAEDATDHCLSVTAVGHITKVTDGDLKLRPKATPWEVDEFVNAIRAMNENETRLILKIHNPDVVNLFPDFQFLGKPCMISNSNGDLIWAAYVEPCEALYEWLISLGTNVEILDPLKFKEDYLSYCEAKLRKIA